MAEIRVITYAKSREAFFEKKLKQAERALDNVVKHGTDPYACDEKGEIVAFYRDALAALREKAEREKGCEWCKENNKVFHDGQHFHMFCSYCGKRLEVEHEN